MVKSTVIVTKNSCNQVKNNNVMLWSNWNGTHYFYQIHWNTFLDGQFQVVENYFRKEKRVGCFRGEKVNFYFLSYKLLLYWCFSTFVSPILWVLHNSCKFYENIMASWAKVHRCLCFSQILIVIWWKIVAMAGDEDSSWSSMKTLMSCEGEFPTVFVHVKCQ